jgi:predicted O-methyltransferase YrrM
MRVELDGLPEPNWFHHGEAILALVEQHRPQRCVELGSNRGCSAIAVARLIRTWGGHLTCVDQWVPGPETVDVQTFAQNVVDAGVADVIGMIHAPTIEAAAGWAGGIDYLYVDADHTEAGCRADLEAWWPHLRVGGLIAGDDYDDVAGDPAHGVTAAWDAFEAAHGQHFYRTLTAATSYHGRLIWGVKA